MSRRRSQVAQSTLDFPITKRVTRSRKSLLQSSLDAESPAKSLEHDVRLLRNTPKKDGLDIQSPVRSAKSLSAARKKAVESVERVSKNVKRSAPSRKTLLQSPERNTEQSPGKRGNMENLHSASPSKKLKMKKEDLENIVLGGKSFGSPGKPVVQRVPFSPVRSLHARPPLSQVPSSPLYNSVKVLDLKQLSSPHKIYNDRVPLSPVRNPQVLSPMRNRVASPNPREVARLAMMNSPVKENCPTPAEEIRKTPLRGVRALNFSQVPGNGATPDPVMTNLKVRSLNFSSSLEEVCQLSPRKSPRKALSASQSVMSPLRLARQEGVSYQRAKQALHTAQPDRVLCREKEMAEVSGFLEGHLDSRTPGSMYISGAPGTGKTAVLSTVREKIQARDDCEVVYMNCMSLKNSMAIYNSVLIQLTGRPVGSGIAAATKRLEQLLTTKGNPLVLILDEIDSLDSKNQEVLYTMFEWPALNKSRAILIGIANSLDLTDRILPRLQARPKCKPLLLHFSPYTPAQISTVLKDRLSKVEVDGQCVLETSAIQFCARKVAAVAGDMRKALDICRRAVEVVQADVRKQRVLQASSGCCTSPIKTPRSPMKSMRSPSKYLRSPSKGLVSPIKGLKSPTKVLRSPIKVPMSPSKSAKSVPRKITVAHIHKIVNEVYGTGVSQTSTQQQSLPVQQKIAVCTLLLLIKQAKLKQVTLGKFHEAYAKVCKRQEMPAIDQSEFLALCTLLEARGMMTFKKAKDTRNSKVGLKLDEREVEHAMQDKRLMTQILSNGL